MPLCIQSALLNVTDLDRSVAFYQDVFGLDLVSRADRLAALVISDLQNRQVLLLRELGPHPFQSGRGIIGPRWLAFEVRSGEELQTIEDKLTERQALLHHAQTAGYRAVLGIDPDRIQVSAAASSSGTPIRPEDWVNLDDLVYSIE